MCQTEPEAVAAHFGAPVEAILSEIKGDYEKLERYARYVQMKQELGNVDEEQVEDGNRVAWREFLGKYKKRLEAEGGGQWEARAGKMRESNPRLTLRNWVLQHAIERAEKGDYGGINEILGSADNIWVGEGGEGVGGGEMWGEGETSKLLREKTKEAPSWAHGVFNT